MRPIGGRSGSRGFARGSAGFGRTQLFAGCGLVLSHHMVGQDEVAHLREHNFSPTTATENAVMTRTRNFEVLFVLARYARAQLVGSLCLTGAGNIVKLTLDGQQGRAFDVLRANTFCLAAGVAHIPGAFDQGKFLEHRFDGFQVVVGIHVQYGVVFVVKLAM